MTDSTPAEKLRDRWGRTVSQASEFSHSPEVVEATKRVLEALNEFDLVVQKARALEKLASGKKMMLQATELLNLLGERLPARGDRDG
ncbi:MAG: hypothetical protein LC723_13380 [Actinobacteria bacterium]|nr:hypothetical protein [Actinomycetota bacterium]